MTIRFNISLEETQETIVPVEPNNELDYADKDEIDFSQDKLESEIEDHQDAINQGMDLAEGMESLAYIASKIDNPTPIHIALFRTAANIAVAGSNYNAESFLPAMESNKPIAMEGFVEKTKEIIAKIIAHIKAMWEKIKAFFSDMFNKRKVSNKKLTLVVENSVKPVTTEKPVIVEKPAPAEKPPTAGQQLNKIIDDKADRWIRVGKHLCSLEILKSNDKITTQQKILEGLKHFKSNNNVFLQFFRDLDDNISEAINDTHGVITDWTSHDEVNERLKIFKDKFNSLVENDLKTKINKTEILSHTIIFHAPEDSELSFLTVQKFSVTTPDEFYKIDRTASPFKMNLSLKDKIVFAKEVKALQLDDDKNYVAYDNIQLIEKEMKNLSNILASTKDETELKILQNKLLYLNSSLNSLKTCTSFLKDYNKWASNISDELCNLFSQQLGIKT